MKKELPNKKVNRWLILTVVALFSLAATFAVYKVTYTVTKSDENSMSDDQDSIVNYDNKEQANVLLETQYNYDEGYVDVLFTTNTPLTLGEVLFTMTEGTTFDSIVEKGVFADYLENAKSEGSVLIGATGGPDADIVMPTEKALFARLAFTNMTPDSVQLSTEDAVFFDEGNEFVTVTFE